MRVLLPDLQNDRAATGQRLERNRKPSGRPQTPIAVTPTVYDHLPTEWLLVPCKWALQGLARFRRPESPRLGVSARLTS
ncbi:hypothetical protein J4732_19255 [Serratia marcescens]|uniref:Uncharacterized protein n=1 Tax=Serratia marcescens TaxID=615 RepID=A0A939SVI0_SERMA|nr:hypothetical protein [Serratia marcescens]